MILPRFLLFEGNTLLHFTARSGDNVTFEYVRGIVGDASPLNNVSYFYFDKCIFITIIKKSNTCNNIIR